MASASLPSNGLPSNLVPKGNKQWADRDNARLNPNPTVLRSQSVQGYIAQQLSHLLKAKFENLFLLYKQPFARAMEYYSRVLHPDYIKKNHSRLMSFHTFVYGMIQAGAFFHYNRDSDINFRSGFDGLTALHYAVVYNKADHVRRLLEYGADPYVENFTDLSAMMDQKRLGQPLFCKEEKGITPFWLACALGRIETVKIFLEHDRSRALTEAHRSALIKISPSYRQISRIGLQSQPDDITKTITISVWHFMFDPNFHKFLWEVLTKNCVLPFHCAAALLASGHEAVQKDVKRILATTMSKFKGHFRTGRPKAAEEDGVLWTFSSVHQETFEFFRLNPRVSGAPSCRVDYQPSALKLPDILLLLAVPAYTPSQRQAQLMFLQHSLTALVVTTHEKSWHPVRDQAFLMYWLIRLGASTQGWQSDLDTTRALHISHVQTEEPYFETPSTLFNKRLSLTCPRACDDFIDGNAVTCFPAVLRVLSKPPPPAEVVRDFYWKFSPLTDGQAFYPWHGTKDAVDWENFVLALLKQGVYLPDLGAYYVDPLTRKVHDGQRCRTKVGDNLRCLLAWDETESYNSLDSCNEVLLFSFLTTNDLDNAYPDYQEITVTLRSKLSFDDLQNSLGEIQEHFHLPASVLPFLFPGSVEVVRPANLWVQELPQLLVKYKADGEPYPVRISRRNIQQYHVCPFPDPEIPDAGEIQSPPPSPKLPRMPPGFETSVIQDLTA